MKVIEKKLSNFTVLFPAFPALVFFSDISFVVLAIFRLFCAVSIYIVVFVLVKFIVKLLYDMGTVLLHIFGRARAFGWHAC